MSKKVSKAIPILTIVFFGIAALFFVLKTVFMSALSLMSSGNLMRVALQQLLNTLAFVVPEALFIIYSAGVLKRNGKANKILSAALLLQAACAVYFAVRIAIYNDDWSHFGKEYAFLILFGCVAVCSLIAFVRVLKEKSARAVMIIAAVSGILIAGVLFVWNGLFMLSSASYFSKHLFLSAMRFGAYTLYVFAFVFHFTAMILAACVKQREKLVTVKMKTKGLEED